MRFLQEDKFILQGAKRFIGVLVLGSLSGCGWFDRDGEGMLLNPKDDYLEAQQHGELQVPEDLRSLEDSDPFPIPETPASSNPTFYPDRPPLPDAIYANDNRDEVRIQRLGDRRWLVIPEAPTTVWPKLKQFLAENAVELSLDAPEHGRLNTGWMKIDQPQYRDVIRALLVDAKQADGLNVGQDRFLIKVEQGLRPLTTEVHVRHENDSLTMPAPDSMIAVQQIKSDIPGAEEDLLREVGAYIAAKVSEQTVSKVALQIGSSKKSELARNERGQPVLRLYLDAERTWATLSQALDNAEVDVLEMDQVQGALSIHIPNSVFTGEEGRGFFCRLTFSCGDREDYDLQLKVSGNDDNFNVSVYDAEGRAPVDPDLAQEVLVLIREYAT